MASLHVTGQVSLEPKRFGALETGVFDETAVVFDEMIAHLFRRFEFLRAKFALLHAVHVRHQVGDEIVL